ncbi:MAG: SCO family protein [Actinomycetota bacterium]|nr:SCO family protein [Actinomycetota bacterium]
MTTSHLPRPRRLLAAALLVPALLMAACSDDEAAPKTLSGYELTPAPSVAQFSLPDASQGEVDFPFKATPGHLLIAYFGYMSCPDVCPTTLNEVKNALAELGDDAAKVDLAMTTVDPNRDTGDKITQYVQSFVPSAHGLRTDDAATLKAVADGFGVKYSVTTNADGEIEVTHSAALYVVDATGTIVLTWPFGILRDGIAADLQILFDRGVK